MKAITQIDELKSIELDIMKKIHKFCVENDIKYFMAYGTLIGAMRHNGFIPWDDDIDIWMKRIDYDKFLELFPKAQEALNLKVVNHKTKSFLGRAMSKVIDDRTILTEPEFRYDDPIGVFVDIWPLDSIPNNQRQGKKLIRSMRFLHRKLYLCITKQMRFNSIKEIAKSAVILLYRKSNSKAILDKMERILRENSEDDPRILFTPAYPFDLYPADYFEGIFLTKFEDAEFYAPIRYDEILTIRYGNWKELPPADKRVPHHIIDVYWK